MHTGKSKLPYVDLFEWDLLTESSLFFVNADVEKKSYTPSLQDSTLSQSFSHKIKHFIDLTDNLILLITGDKRKDDEKKKK